LAGVDLQAQIGNVIGLGVNIVQHTGGLQSRAGQHFAVGVGGHQPHLLAQQDGHRGQGGVWQLQGQARAHKRKTRGQRLGQVRRRRQQSHTTVSAADVLADRGLQLALR
jgi:hypothetical protein